MHPVRRVDGQARGWCAAGGGRRAGRAAYGARFGPCGAMCGPSPSIDGRGGGGATRDATPRRASTATPRVGGRAARRCGPRRPRRARGPEERGGLAGPRGGPRERCYSNYTTLRISEKRFEFSRKGRAVLAFSEVIAFGSARLLGRHVCSEKRKVLTDKGASVGLPFLASARILWCPYGPGCAYFLGLTS